MHYPWPDDLQRLVDQTLTEDLGSGDVTADLIPERQTAQAEVLCRDAAVICGVDFFNAVFTQLDASIDIDWLVHEGDAIDANTVVCRLNGPARPLLTGERSALNLLQTLSAVATTTQRFSAYLNHSKTQLLDTRKTIPGLRLAQKYAVSVGGGQNHRLGLYDRVLIKENHIMACGGIAAAIQQARQLHPDLLVETEVENLNELREALDAKADIIMLDNFDLNQAKHAVTLTAGHAKLEISGNVDASSLQDIASTGVDYVSSGALTKHLYAIDFSFRLKS